MSHDLDGKGTGELKAAWFVVHRYLTAEIKEKNYEVAS
jgi:hypothetical protein